MGGSYREAIVAIVTIETIVAIEAIVFSRRARRARRTLLKGGSKLAFPSVAERCFFILHSSFFISLYGFSRSI